MSEEKIKVHIILDQTDQTVVDVIESMENVEVVQWDYSFDTAYQWSLHNELTKVDVFFASEFAQVSTVTEEGKQVPRDTALLRKVRDLHLMRPKTKFAIICDEERDRSENRHFLANLVSLGVYDFRVADSITEDTIKSIIEEPARDITHVQAYLPENVQGAKLKPFENKDIDVYAEIEQKEKKKAPISIDIFKMIQKSRKNSGEEGEKQPRKPRKPKVKHIVEKVRPSVVSFFSAGACDGKASLLALNFALKLASKEAKTALLELHSSGIPRLGYESCIRSRARTTETCLQRIEDQEDILNILTTPTEAVDETPSFESGILSRIKQLPSNLHILGGRDNIMPGNHPFRNIKGSTLEAAPGELVNQLIFRHSFDCAVFSLSGEISHKLVYHALKVSNYVYLIVDQHPAHLSWLRQNLTIINKVGIPFKNIRIVMYPYYELSNIRFTDLEAALGTEIDYTIPDVNSDLLNSVWGSGEIKDTEFHKSLAEMIWESTGHKLPELSKKDKKSIINIPEISLLKNKADTQNNKAEEV